MRTTARGFCSRATFSRIGPSGTRGECHLDAPTRDTSAHTGAGARWHAHDMTRLPISTKHAEFPSSRLSAPSASIGLAAGRSSANSSRCSDLALSRAPLHRVHAGQRGRIRCHAHRSWRAHGCMTRARAHSMLISTPSRPAGRTNRPRPGSYAWPRLRREAEHDFARGSAVLTTIARLRERHASGAATVPSIRTMRRWFSQGRWLRLPATALTQPGALSPEPQLAKFGIAPRVYGGDAAGRRPCRPCGDRRAARCLRALGRRPGRPRRRRGWRHRARWRRAWVKIASRRPRASSRLVGAADAGRVGREDQDRLRTSARTARRVLVGLAHERRSVAASPLIRKAVTFAFCHTARTRRGSPPAWCRSAPGRPGRAAAHRPPSAGSSGRPRLRRLGASAACGSSTTVEPSPAVLSSRIRPPWASRSPGRARARARCRRSRAWPSTRRGRTP